MNMDKLYPPVIEGTIPAFYGDEIIVPYSMNKVVNYNDEVAGFSLKIKTVQNNLHLGSLTTIILKNGEYDYSSHDEYNARFLIPKDWFEGERPKINIGQYYKVQMAYVKNIGTKEAPILITGYYSTVGVVKCTSKPEVSIDGLDKAVRNAHQYEYIGRYKQNEDWTEKVYSYNFKVWDIDNNVIADSGELLHMSANDISANESFDTFSLTQELVQNTSYYIQYTVTTTNGLVAAQKYRLSPRQSVLPELKAELLAELNQENGYVQLTLKGEVDNKKYEKSANGVFLLTRRKSNEPGKWENLFRFALRGQKPSSWSWRDFTVEQGITYVYSIQQYSNTLYSQRIESNSIYVDFEHAFLFDGVRQLKIKYNPKISSFKTTILESKIDTLGSKHPFIFRNGNVSYKDFPISGLISYLMDEEKLFMNTDIYNFTNENIARDYFDSTIPRTFVNRTTNLTGENIYRERDFKLNVLNWLNNGEPKLFRSPTEGNYIVRLMNNSLSPTDSVGRMLHTFSSNAYEIADYNYKNLTIYNFIDENEKDEVENKKVIQWASIETFNILKNTKTGDSDVWTENVLPSGRQALEIDVVGMLPGDKIQIVSEGETREIVIGATGSYKVLNIAPVTSLKLLKDNAMVNGIITYNFETVYSNAFGLYYDAKAIDIPAKQIFGYQVIGKNIMEYLEDLKTSILNVYYLKFEKRPIQIVYADSGSDVVITQEDMAVNISMSNLYYDRYKTMPVVADELDAYTIYQIHLNSLDKNAEVEYNQDYYLDNNFNKFFPKHGAFIDMQASSMGLTAVIRQEDNYNLMTKVFIDPEIDEELDINTQLAAQGGIDLAETEDYLLEDFKPKKLYIGTGVIATIGYCVSSVIYNFEVDSRYESMTAKQDYDAAVAHYEKVLNEYIGSDEDKTALALAEKNIKTTYAALLKQLEEDLETYKKESGLE